MSNALALIRSLIIYSLCLPLAIFLGYLLAMPMDRVSYTIVVATVLLPLLPVLLKWHHLLLFACWNTSMALFFLQGSPNLWLVMAAISFTLALLQHILNRNLRFISVPSLTRPLLFLVIVIFVTAKLTGGFGMRTLGGESMGGKRYFLLFGAIMGYFAMTFYRIPEGKAATYVALYFLGTLTAIVGGLAPFVDPSVHFIFALFPVESLAAIYGGGKGTETIFRLGGLTFAAVAVVCYILARHGVRELFRLSEPWRFFPVRFRGGLSFPQPWRTLIFLGMIWISLMGGYRSAAIIMGMAFLIQFYLEGLFRTQLFPAMLMVVILSVAVTLPMIQKLPFMVQRSLSFLPIQVDPLAREAAEASTEWRLRMWREVLPSVPDYLLLGKGYAINPAELAQTIASPGRTPAASVEGTIMASDFHNGPLSVVIPLGGFGVIGFLWFLYATFKLLLNNFRHGSAALRQINTFLLAYFIARVIFFMLVFGTVHGELVVFTGLAGLSVSLNGGLAKPEPEPVAEKPVLPQFKLARVSR